ncbi:MAG TPA: divalent metal cation transporter, partial [Polyangiaceae bacterium]|nr:divalent metal cation transporter [Polyangiaceae bacterium]
MERRLRCPWPNCPGPCSRPTPLAPDRRRRAACAKTDPARLYLAIGILGATVMPHNLYLHSSIVQTRRYQLDPAGRRDAARLATL